MKNLVVRWKFLPLVGLILCFLSCHSRSQNAQNQLQEAEELYYQGISSNNSSQYESSTVYLKQAEEILVSLPESPRRNQLLGLTWFRLGNTSESDMLYDIAQTYYRKSIPLLNPDSNAVPLSCLYRDIARTMAITGNSEKDSVLWYFNKAEELAERTGSELLLLDIDAYRYQLCYPDSVSHRFAICKRLAEEFNVPTRYSEIVELLLAQHATDSAAHYLERLQPTDSTYTYWFEQTYTYLNSKILRQRKQTDKAYSVLLDLYDRKIDELQRDAGARTYALSLHYDVAREQQLVQEAQREQRWHKRLSAILVLTLGITVLLLINLFLYYRAKRREQAAQMQALRDKYVQQLELALERLRQKVNLTKEIELQRMRGNEVEFPKWLQTYRDEKLVMNKESVDELISSIDKALDGAISRLQTEYPALTESDMQYAILSIIGASDTDMSIVLNVQKQTIYHRRQIVRKHVEVNGPTIDDIDVWLRSYVLR